MLRRTRMTGCPVRRFFGVVIVVFGDDQVVWRVLDVVLVRGDLGVLLLVAQVVRSVAGASWITAHGDRLCPEAVSHAGVGQQVPRPRRLRLELAAELRDIYAQVSALRLVRRPPALLEQLPLGHQGAPVADEDLKA